VIKEVILKFTTIGAFKVVYFFRFLKHYSKVGK